MVAGIQNWLELVSNFHGVLQHNSGRGGVVHSCVCMGAWWWQDRSCVGKRTWTVSVRGTGMASG